MACGMAVLSSFAVLWMALQSEAVRSAFDAESEIKSDANLSIEAKYRFQNKVALVDLALDSSVKVTGSRRAFLAAITYIEKFSTGVTPLQTIPDALMVFQRLTEKGFKASDITVVMDDPAGQSEFPGADVRILNDFRTKTASYLWTLLNEAQANVKDGDLFVLHFSGHGVQVPDVDGDELDGQDEAFVAASYPHDGLIMDDDLYKWIVKFPLGSVVTWVADACHSEGLSDLPFNYNPGYVSTQPSPLGGHALVFVRDRRWCTDWVNVQPSLPSAVVRYFSGSQNDQTSIGSSGGGALTHQLWKDWAVDKTGVQGTMYKRMKQILVDFKQGRETITHRAVTQEPNVAAFPMFRDTGVMTMWQGDLRHDSAFGGLRPSNKHYLRGPDRCKHKRMTVRDNGGFLFDTKLNSAEDPIQKGHEEGWVAQLDATPPIQVTVKKGHYYRLFGQCCEVKDGWADQISAYASVTCSGKEYKVINPADHNLCQPPELLAPVLLKFEVGKKYLIISGYKEGSCCTLDNTNHAGANFLVQCDPPSPNSIPPLTMKEPSEMGAECHN